MSRLLITGGRGFLGRHLAQYWAQRGYEVVLMTRNTSTSDTDFATVGSVADLGAQKINALIHCATSYGRPPHGIEEVLRTNLVLSLELLEWAWKNQCPFLNVDTALPRDTSPYALAKAQFRGWLDWATTVKGLTSVNLRLQHFYGAGDNEDKFTSYVIRSCARNVPVLELTAGDQVRDFIHIDDVVAAFDVALKEVEKGVRTSEFEVGSGKGETIRHFVETVKRVTNSATVPHFGAIPYRSNEPMHCVADVTPLIRLGWRPTVALEDGIASVVRREREQ
jgi:CDP-paratose synthetase